MAKVREAVGPDCQIAIDAHGRFDLQGAKMAARAMEPLKILFFEEPEDKLRTPRRHGEHGA